MPSSLLRRLASPLTLACALFAAAGAGAADLKEIRLDYAAYSAPSLVVKKFGWAEQEFKQDGTSVKWLQSPSGEHALQALAAGTLDLASTVGTAALQARADGNPVKTVYVNSRWTAAAGTTYGFLNTQEQFLAAHLRQVERVIAVYERARKWIAANPDAAARIVAEQANLPLADARSQLARSDFTVSRPGPAQAQALKSAGAALVRDGQIKPGTDVGRVVDELLDDKPVRAAVRASERAAEANGEAARLALGW